MNKGSSTRANIGDTGVKSANRVLDIIELLVDASGGRVLSDIARSLGIPKSSVHALVSTLVKRGYLNYSDGTRTYTLGIRLWEAGGVFNLYEELRRQALPLMQRLVDDMDEIVQLAVRDGKQNVYLAKVDCKQPIQLVSRVGARLPCHATGLGKALLSGLSDDELDALYGTDPLPSLTPQTCTSLDALKHELSHVRLRGFAEDREEYAPGLCCVAVPVRRPRNVIVASVSMSFPAGRASSTRLEQARELLMLLSEELSRRLGYRDGEPYSGPAASAGGGPCGGRVFSEVTSHSRSSLRKKAT